MAIIILLIYAFAIGLVFWGYKLRHFFRLFFGLWAGLLISFTTGVLMFMDGTRGDLTRLVMNLGGGKLLSKAISDGDLFGLLRLLLTNDTARDILMKILPDSAKAFMVFAVLFCIASTIVCAVWEKPGVCLELFAYGYTVTASICMSNGSTLMGAILGIAVGALLGMLGYKISRIWIIISTSLLGGIIFNFGAGVFLLFSGSGGFAGHLIFGLISLIGVIGPLLIPVGIFVQVKITSVPKSERTAQSGTISAGLKGKWAEKFKAVTNFVPPMPSAQSKANPSSKSTPSASGQKFCPQCGNSLAPGAKFCAKCGTPTRSGEDATKPM